MRSIEDALVLDLFAGTGAARYRGDFSGAAFALVVQRRQGCYGAVDATISRRWVGGGGGGGAASPKSTAATPTYLRPSTPMEPFSLVFSRPAPMQKVLPTRPLIRVPIAAGLRRAALLVSRKRRRRRFWRCQKHRWFE